MQWAMPLPMPAMKLFMEGNPTCPEGGMTFPLMVLKPLFQRMKEMTWQKKVLLYYWIGIRISLSWWLWTLSTLTISVMKPSGISPQIIDLLPRCPFLYWKPLLFRIPLVKRILWQNMCLLCLLILNQLHRNQVRFMIWKHCIPSLLMPGKTGRKKIGACTGMPTIDWPKGWMSK